LNTAILPFDAWVDGSFPIRAKNAAAWHWTAPAREARRSFGHEYLLHC